MQIASTRRPHSTMVAPKPQPAAAENAAPKDTFQAGSAPVPDDIFHDGRPWETRNQPAVLVGQSADGSKRTYSGFRWGWNEAPDVENWTPNFQNTTIDTSKLKDVHYYVEHFFPAGHGALVFEFEDGAVQGADGQSTNKMVYSIEARKKEGDQWTWQRGLKKTMGMVHQLMTFDDAKQWVTRRQGATLETRRLKLTAEEKQALLSTALDEAVKDRTGEYYHTTRNSCYSGLNKVMNKALPDKSIPLMSNLTAGLLMKPEMFLTSAYNTVLKDKGLHSGERAQFYLPDPKLHPQEHITGLQKGLHPSWVNGVAESPLFAPALDLAGTAAGAGAGYLLAGQALGLGPIGTAIATVGLGYIGHRTGLLVGDYMEGNAQRTIVNGDLSLVKGGAGKLETS